ncbi:MAG: DUF1853 family protein [Bacteroidetes bacterium]|nr:DUF1853 family protein [Bacteroidota bacterium]NOG56887.1 DUF1853 family protein [Bacteroidota bacterium]
MKDEQIERITLCNSITENAFQDLYWLISSETLSKAFLPEFHYPLNNQTNLIEQINQLPITCISNLNTKQRLGKYAEQLIEIYLEQIDNKQIIGKNIQLIEEKKTIGEIDFLIQSNSEDFIHLEFALKYYVKIVRNETVSYIGPNMNDNWLNKIKKLKNHQIQLTDKYTALLPLAFQKIKFQKRILVLGQIFDYNQLNQTNWAIPIKGLSQLNEFATYFTIMPNRLNWIFPFREEHELITFSELKNKLKHIGENAVMVCCYDKNKSPISWGFIMYKFIV